MRLSSEHRLDDISGIRVSFRTGETSEPARLDVLVVSYTGTYRFGSAGNPDAQYMCAMARAGISAFDPWAVVHDLWGLSYDWGDRLEEAMYVAPEHDPDAYVASVIGPACEAGVRSLMGIGQDPLPERLGIFRTLNDALADCERAAVACWARQPGRGIVGEGELSP